VDQVSRRVVVTGVGLVCGLGIGTDEVWKNLLAGKSGIRSITHFDASAFDCTIAGEVRDFDPLHWAEKKEIKKIARFIQLALAATDFAMRMSDLKITPEMAESTGVYVASGIGGFDVIEREHSKLLPAAPDASPRFSFPRRLSIWLRGTFPSATERRGRIRLRPRRARLPRMRWEIPSA
jgi:3-oxoacyl-[acyl-carrier-protein] synthase II